MKDIMATRLTTISDPITGVDDSTTNTTEVSEIVAPYKLSLPKEPPQSNKMHKQFPLGASGLLQPLDEHQLLKETYMTLKGGSLPEQHRSLNVIPWFYNRPPREESILAQKMREEARSHFLKERSTELLDNQEVCLILVYIRISLLCVQEPNFKKGADNYTNIPCIFNWIIRCSKSFNFWKREASLTLRTAIQRQT